VRASTGYVESIAGLWKDKGDVTKSAPPLIVKLQSYLPQREMLYLTHV